jgi:endonuclease YncB( thermonuclease family)/membrane-bound metal-dependent hydrolase YbcI (DUF457 family)
LWNRLGPLVHLLTALIAPTWWAVLYDAPLSPGLLLLCALLGLLPDIDSAASHIGRLAPEIAQAIERRWGHRTLTHSCLAILLVAVVTVPLTDHWFLTIAYASHILLDMIIGGNTGVTLLWPLRYRYTFAHIDPASPGELIIGLLAFAFVLFPLAMPTLAVRAAEVLPEKPMPTPTKTPTATPSPAPTLVSIKIDHVYNIAAEILVQTGDKVTQGQPVADLQTWRATLQAPPPTPTPTWVLIPTDTPTLTPTPYVPPTVNPLVLQSASADLEVARAQATLAAAPPNEDAITRECDRVTTLQSQLEAMKNQLWADQLQRDAAKIRAQEPGSNIPWEQIGAMEAKLFEQERQIAEQAGLITQQQQSCDAIRSQPHDAGADQLAVAAAQLQRAEVRYLQAIATPTQPPTPTPTATATPSPTATPWTPPSDEHTRIYSLVTGDVYAIKITGNGNQARVEIEIATGYSQPLSPSPNLGEGREGGFQNLAEGWDGGQLATVIHVSDGDTLDVQFSDGSIETIRLLDVNTPETVKPNAPVECYGPEASHHTKTRLCGNDTGDHCAGIEVQIEPAERDRYGRLLGYLWLDGELYNEELTAQGFAVYNDYGNPHQYSHQVAQAAAAAQTQGIGLWAACPVP